MHILVVDDHHLIREGLRVALDSLANEVRVSEAQSAAQALDCASNFPDLNLILLDLHLPDADGVGLLQQLRELREDVPVVVLSGDHEAQVVRTCIETGAMGFIPKTLATPALLDALRVVLRGESYLPEDVSMPPVSASAPSSSFAEFNLTPREVEVTLLLLRALPNKLIARELGISLSTVKQHMHAIQYKFGATSRYDIMRRAHQLGLGRDPQAGR